MSILVVGVSHKTAPVCVLERLALDTEGVAKLITRVLDCEHVRETTVLATCNRIEVYADVDRFHNSVDTVSRLLAESAGQRPEDVVPHLYVHYDDGAVAHLFDVVTGLDSMVLGESQILGQTREALRTGQDLGAVGPTLNLLFQQALRVGKRAHAETDIDAAARSLVSVALETAADHVGAVHGKRAVVLGAGSMAALATATVSRLGAVDIVIGNRTPASATRLAGQYDARAVAFDDIAREITAADIVISCTGATELVLPVDRVAAARVSAANPLAIIDLALPHDVDPAVADLPGVELITLATLASAAEDLLGAGDVDAVRSIVQQEIDAFVAARRSARVTPTVVALRSLATGVVESEMARLRSRVPELDPRTEAELELTVRRVAEKLLHQPTVRVKQLANEDGAVSYAAALAELFALEAETVQAVTRPEAVT